MPANLRSALNLGSDVSVNTYTQTFSTASRTVPAATAVNPPAGGTGAAAGGYDTAGNRDLAITSLTAVIADVATLRQIVTGIIDDLQAHGLIG